MARNRQYVKTKEYKETDMNINNCIEKCNSWCNDSKKVS